MKKRIMMLGLISILLPINIKALTGSVSLSCESTAIIANSSTTCTLSGYSEEEVSSLSSKLSTSGNISVTNISTSSSWQGNGEGGSIDLYTDSNKSGNFAIATFTLNAGQVGTGIINVNGIVFSDASFNEHSISSKSLSITVKEEEKEVIKEEKPKENNNTNQVSKPESNKQNNNQNNNQIAPVVETKSNDATLKSLVLSEGVINFNKNVISYNIEVSNDVESITINADASNSKAKVIKPDDLSLKLGKNDFEVKVIAEDGTEKVYTICVTRLEKVLSNNSKLKKIEIEGYKLTLESDKYVYDLKNIKSLSLKINAIPENKNAKVTVHGSNNIGKNDAIVIEVTAEDGTVSEYIIYVNNTKNKSTNVSFIVILVLFIISFGFNIFFIINKKKSIKNDQKSI